MYSLDPPRSTLAQRLQIGNRKARRETTVTGECDRTAHRKFRTHPGVLTASIVRDVLALLLADEPVYEEANECRISVQWVRT